MKARKGDEMQNEGVLENQKRLEKWDRVKTYQTPLPGSGGGCASIKLVRFHEG